MERHRTRIGPTDGWMVGTFIHNDVHSDRHRRHRAFNRLAGAAGLSDAGSLRPRARCSLQRHRDAGAGDHRAGIRGGCGFSLVLAVRSEAEDDRRSREQSVRARHSNLIEATI
jgi:hypothetical protein